MWDFLLDLTFDIINFFYSFCGDWGLAIIIVTVIFRLVLMPLMHKQIKSSYHMQKLQPLMKEIQQKYANDPVRYNEEMQKLYAEGHFNPLAGCLPMLLQMPIFMLVPSASFDGRSNSGVFLRVLFSCSEPDGVSFSCYRARIRALFALPYPDAYLLWCDIPSDDSAVAQPGQRTA